MHQSTGDKARFWGLLLNLFLVVPLLFQCLQFCVAMPSDLATWLIVVYVCISPMFLWMYDCFNCNLVCNNLPPQKIANDPYAFFADTFILSLFQFQSVNSGLSVPHTIFSLMSLVIHTPPLCMYTWSGTLTLQLAAASNIA